MFLENTDSRTKIESWKVSKLQPHSKDYHFKGSKQKKQGFGKTNKALQVYAV